MIIGVPKETYPLAVCRSNRFRRKDTPLGAPDRVIITDRLERQMTPQCAHSQLHRVAHRPAPMHVPGHDATVSANDAALPVLLAGVVETNRHLEVPTEAKARIRVSSSSSDRSAISPGPKVRSGVVSLRPLIRR